MVTASMNTTPMTITTRCSRRTGMSMLDIDEDQPTVGDGARDAGAEKARAGSRLQHAVGRRQTQMANELCGRQPDPSKGQEEQEQ